MEILVLILALACVGFWVFSAVNWWLAVSNRKLEQPLSSFLFNGMKSFDSDNFTDEGQRYQKRFLIGFGGFFASIFLAIAAAAIAGGLQ